MTGVATIASMLNLPGRQVLRPALYILTVILWLAWMPPVRAESAQQAVDSPTLTHQAGKVAEHAATLADTPDTPTVDSGNAGRSDNKDRKDLTVFFSIGVIVDILLVAAFLYWAVGQWSRSKK